MARRRFLLGLCILATALAAAGSEPRPLTILHFNDLHAQLTPRPDGGGGVAHLATAIRKEKAGCNWCLVLSAGDFVQGSPVSTMFRGVPIIEIANLLGIDTAIPGNHEYDYGWEKVEEYRMAARFPFLAANLRNTLGGAAMPPYQFFRVGDLRVAVIGAMTGDFVSLQTPDRIDGMKTSPPVATVRRYLGEILGGADLIVLLAHFTPEEEDQALRELPEVPVIVSGHVHGGLEAPKRLDNRILVRAKSNALELGRLDLKVDAAAKRLVSSEWKRIPVGKTTVPAAADVEAAVARWEAKVAEAMDVPIAENRRAWTRPELKALIERAIAESTGSDLGFCNRGGIRADLPVGTILVRHIWNMYPFDSRVVKGRFRGSQLPASVTAGRQIDPDRIYTLVTNEYTAANQSRPSELNATGMEFPEFGAVQRDLLVEWFKKQKVLE
jgi:2',3'-cyclic-nucleotide 2'-phosphodiesterase (5'-nucleotidase family)